VKAERGPKSGLVKFKLRCGYNSKEIWCKARAGKVDELTVKVTAGQKGWREEKNTDTRFEKRLVEAQPGRQLV
jgi:hypothetical protein